MIGHLRSELLKQRSTPAALLLFVAMFGLVAFAVAMHVLALGAARLAARDDQLSVFQVGTRAGMLFAGLVGAIAITSEIRYGTIRPTLLMSPRRGRVIAAKLSVSALAGIGFGLVAEALMAAAAAVAFAARGIDNQLTGGDYLQLLVGGAAAAALWGAIGLGLGAFVRNQVGAIVALCVWMLLVESTSDTLVPNAARLLPGGAGLALAGNVDALSAVTALVLLVAYAATVSAVGWMATVRRDIA